MPRKRHDTSSDDSDSSEEEIRSGKRDHRGTANRDQRYDDSSPKRSRRSHEARRRMDSERESSPDVVQKRGKESRRFSSDSDTSPMKRSVVSKVEKAGAPSGRGGRDTREFDNRNRDRGDDRRNFRGVNQGQRLNRRDDSQDAFSRRNDLPSGRMSPDRRQRRVSSSPERQRVEARLPRRQERLNRSPSQDRNDFRNESRRSFSPDRNARFGQRRNDYQSLGRGQRSPGRGQGWRDQQGRGRLEDSRGQGYRNEQHSRSFDRQDRGQDRNRQNRGRSRSPTRNISRTRNDSDVSFEQKAFSPTDLRSNRGQRSSVSPVRSNKDRMSDSVSPEKSERSKMKISEKKKNTPVNSPLKSKSKGGIKTKKTKEKSMDRNFIESEEEIEKLAEISKKNKKKKKKDTEKDDSLERSFERSKQLLEENSHSKDIDIPESDDSAQGLSPSKSRKKFKSKRQREYSESEQEVSSKKSKKAKNDLESTKTVNKKLQKKSKKRKSASRSASPDERSSDRYRSRSSDKNRSRSSERSFGRNHDMAQFESEPESGEITDSEEEAEKARQSMKSFIKKPSGEDDRQSLEDERWLNQKKKASKMKEKNDMSKNGGEKERGKERGSKRKVEETKEPEPKAEPELASKKPKPATSGVEALTGRTGGAYIPPARLRAMQAKITDKSSVEFQRISWEALKKSINGLVNKVNVGNIENIVRELFQENIVRGRGLMARSIIQAQSASPTFTHVYAALVSIVNTKFPQNGELILRRLIIQFRRGYKRNDKSICLSATRFIAHLVNQQVAHEVLALEVLTLLLETPTDDSVEVAIGFLKECGQKLTEVTPRGINAIFERLRNILHEGQIDIRVQYMCEVMFAVRKDHFKDFPAVIEDLDLVEEEDQFTHLLTLEDAVNGEDILNVFKPDPAFEENEEKYKILKKEILGEGSSDEEEGSGSGSGSDSEEEESEEDEEAKQKIIDQTETNMVALRRTIYLTIQSSLDFEECAHKLLKMDLKPGQEVELCNMILDCCGQMRTYEKFFGLLAGRFCMIDKKYVEPFQVMFKEQYDTIHRLETNKLRNVAKFFAHLLHTDSISWAVLQAIRLNEDDTTSASRIFIKILFQELSEYLGLPKLNERLKDPTLQEYYSGLLPRDNPRDTRFAINFFTTIGLGGLTDDLRDHLKDVSKKLMQQKQEEQAQAIQDDSDDDSDDSSDESDETEDSDSSDSSSESDSSDDDRRRKRKTDKKSKAAVEKGKRTKDLGRKEKIVEKEAKKNRDKTNGAADKRGRHEDEKVYKKDRKKSRKATGETHKDRKSEEDVKREQEEQFKKLAKLANYGNIDDIGDHYGQETRKSGDDRRKHKKDKREKGKDKKAKKGKRTSDNEDYDDGVIDGRSDVRKRIPDQLDEFDARAYADRSFDSSFEERGGRGGVRDDRGGGDRRDRRGEGLMRGDRGGIEDRGRSRGESGKTKGQGKKGREMYEDDLEDKNIRVERNFERMDMYEEKFERERERNLEQVRGREEFQDYYRAREGNDMPRGGVYRGRELPYKGGRDVERFDLEERGFDRGYDDDRRRGRNRSEERIAQSDRIDRRRRR